LPASTRACGEGDGAGQQTKKAIGQGIMATGRGRARNARAGKKTRDRERPRRQSGESGRTHGQCCASEGNGQWQPRRRTRQGRQGQGCRSRKKTRSVELRCPTEPLSEGGRDTSKLLRRARREHGVGIPGKARCAMGTWVGESSIGQGKVWRHGRARDGVGGETRRREAQRSAPK